MPPRADALVSPIFQTAAKFPLSQQLANIFRYEAKHNTRTERAAPTTDVVSPVLCDDVLDYIGPSLDEYKGCDVIDLHPGACLWSQKLHDYLKPRRHLLMEPEERYFNPFIKPLIERPGSAYRHTTKSGAHPKKYFDAYEKIFNDELLPSRQPLPRGDPRLREPNKTLLVTGTLSRRYSDVRGHNNNVHNANMLLQQMIHASQTNWLFHSYGLVRMLFWHPQDTKTTVVPDVVGTRGGFSAGLEVAADLVEVAAADHSLTYDMDAKRHLTRFRHSHIDQIGADRVLRRMESTGVHMPVHRRTLLHKAAIERQENDPAAAEEEARLRIPIHLPKDLSLEEIITAQSKKLKEVNELIHAKGKRASLTLPYKYVFPEVAQKVFSKTDMSRLGPFMDLWGTQLALEAAVVRTRSDSPDHEQMELEAKVKKLAEDLRAMYSTKNMLGTQLRSLGNALLHEIQAFDGGLLAHDRRPYEPLKVEVDEFWPQFGLFLLDVTPRSQSPATDLVAAGEAHNTQRELVTLLFTLSASPVTTAMDRMGANAGRDLLPQVPALTDAGKGGRLDVEDMPVRLLTREMISQLTSTYLEWPFRPANDDAK